MFRKLLLNVTRGVRIVSAPHRTAYGSYEFLLEDRDGRQIGIGLIVEKDVYLQDADWNPAEAKHPSTGS